MEERKLKLNPDKKEILVVGTAHRKDFFNESSSFSMSGAEVPVSEKVRNLGVLIDSNLTLRNELTEIKRVGSARSMWSAPPAKVVNPKRSSEPFINC